MERTDILIAGGGIAGLTAAARLAADGRSVTLVDPAPPEAAEGRDLRTTAFLQPAIATLRHAGAWEAMQEGAAPLRVMRIIDAGGRARRPRETADFTGPETGSADGLFGWNVPNRLAKRALLDRLAQMPQATLVHGAAVTGYLARTREAILTLSDGRRLAAKLAIGADGRDSALRALAGIGHRRWAYGQSAMVFCVTHPEPLHDTSTEIHRSGGPLTTVPMPDLDGAPCTSIVWLMDAADAERRSALTDAELGAELTAETMGAHGPMSVVGPRAVWPMISQVALGLTAPRLALVAEAAHVMPPIGAQGLNTSLSDIETLASLTAASSDPGDPRLLARYQARQMPMILAKVAGIDLLNRMVQTDIQPIRDLRALGLGLVNRLPPVRRAAIKAGMGG